MRIFNKAVLAIIFIISAVVLFHNVVSYEALEGFCAGLHIEYSRIVSEHFRLPTYEETIEAYNPPIFYIISGFVVKAYSLITNQSFLASVNSWRFAAVILSLASFWIWFKLYLHFNKKNFFSSAFFLLFLISLPIINKTVTMFNIDVFSMIMSTGILGYFTFWYYNKQTYLKTLILAIIVSISLITRVSFMSLALAVLPAIILVGWKNHYSFGKIFYYFFIFLSIVGLLVGWFYLGGQKERTVALKMHEPTYGKNPNKVDFIGKLKEGFFTDTRFVLMMNYPVRPYFSKPNFLIPIFYSDFWGDYWNYFPQTRFHENRSINSFRYVFTKKRITALAWQNRLNLLPTMLMIIGFFYFFLENMANLVKGRIKKLCVPEILMELFIVLTWLSFIYIATKYQGEGDYIKPSYMLYVTPVFVYFAVKFLFLILVKVKPLFYFLLAFLLITFINNLIFGFF